MKLKQDDHGFGQSPESMVSQDSDSDIEFQLFIKNIPTNSEIKAEVTQHKQTR